MDLELDPKITALVLIDLQNAIVSREGHPHPAADVIARGAKLAAAFREKGSTVVYVRVDLANLVKIPVDQPALPPGAPPPPPSASELVPEAGMQPGDLLITKRHWGAFTGTDLEQQLRSRGITTMVIGGIATNFGVESTARVASGLGFATVFVEDAMTTISEEAHRFAIEKIFPRIGKVRSTEQVMASIV